jgi:curved DNA-binding protein CbpA
MSELDCYAVLGVTPSASLAEIKAAYRRFVLRAHPDRGGEAAEFRRVTEAFKTLRDPVKRLEYDHSLRAGTQEPDQTSPPSTRPARPPMRTRGPVLVAKGPVPNWIHVGRVGYRVVVRVLPEHGSHRAGHAG